MASDKLTPVVLKDEAEFKPLIEANNEFLTVVSFIATWSENCSTTKELTRELLSDPDLQKVLFVELEAEEFPNVCKEYSINSVPTVVFIQNQNVIERLVGADVRNYASRVVNHANNGPSVEGVPVKTVPKSSKQDAHGASGAPTEPLKVRLERLINKATVMLFMKGDRDVPRCGFSRQIVDILKEAGMRFETFNILEDEEVRQGLKDYSQWQTYPQLYINGTLMGGLDIVREMQEMGTLQDALDGKGVI